MILSIFSNNKVFKTNGFTKKKTPRFYSLSECSITLLQYFICAFEVFFYFYEKSLFNLIKYTKIYFQCFFCVCLIQNYVWEFLKRDFSIIT